MNLKKLLAATAACLLFSCLWLVLMILSVMKTGNISTFEEAIASVTAPGALFYLSYLNAVFVTVSVTIFFVYLYYCCKPFNPEWSLAGLIFIPVYCLLNLIVYVLQITVIPRLADLMSNSPYPQSYEVILGQLVQGWPGSAISVLNQLAYAVLGISSIIFGVLILKSRRLSALASWLLLLNGIACIIGLVGTMTDYQALTSGSVVGGALFIFSLAAIVVDVHQEIKRGPVIEEAPEYL